MRTFAFALSFAAGAAVAILPSGCGTSSGSAAVPAPPGADAATNGDGSVVTTASCPTPPPSGLPIATLDLLGHPPYAADGCTLVYVGATDGGPGDLRVRDRSTGAEVVLAPASESPRRPTVSGDVIAWEAIDNGRAVVRVHAGGTTFTAGGAFDHAGEPRAAADVVAFTAWLGAADTSDTDVLVFDVATKATRTVFGGPGQQRFADASKGTIAATDFSEDPDGTFNDNETDLADIVLFDRATLAVTHRARTGKQAFPMIASATRLGYLDWGLVHPEPKLAAYALRVGDLAGPPEADVQLANVTNSGGYYVLPAGREGVLAWIDRPLGAQADTLWLAPVDLSAPAAPAPGLAGRTLYAPGISGALTFLATQATASAPVVLTFVGTSP
jgi:hypothetical protein